MSFWGGLEKVKEYAELISMGPAVVVLVIFLLPSIIIFSYWLVIGMIGIVKIIILVSRWKENTKEKIKKMIITGFNKFFLAMFEIIPFIGTILAAIHLIYAIFMFFLFGRTTGFFSKKKKKTEKEKFKKTKNTRDNSKESLQLQDDNISEIDNITNNTANTNSTVFSLKTVGDFISRR